MDFFPIATTATFRNAPLTQTARFEVAVFWKKTGDACDAADIVTNKKSGT